MRSGFFAAFILGLSIASPVPAQQWEMPPADETPPSADAPDDPMGEIGQGIEGMMDQLFNRLQPHLEGLGNELSSTMNEFSPAMDEFARLVDDFGNYHRPERLPNGDIILRRRADAPPPPSMEELQKLLPENDRDRGTAPERWSPPENSPPMPQTEL
ncbi:hypothetical protein [Paracoccus aerodenitrificans]|uniref:hypothetical protein n=1 Tax=Paracoccus aerodenitrificans TaxID=3017781 RepID=UPI0022F0D17F|nr:hypothetical protein [Paracoccus aerodenitrificans]WBU64914.1 hypothetical protein PAE61_05615 [Paracoccus aerodenitrificans]